ncbi:MAG: LacI family transcriptional regulator [Spirochaetales bacterium]|nr:MAG: LacI family transcriptional regulator [Spirochaetales bacterium]
MKPPLTIIDIARMANVSPSAVSIALNGRKGISEPTRSRILKIIEDVKYIPNQQARRLLLKYTNNIGILHEEHRSPLDHLFHVEITGAILNNCDDYGYNAVFTSIKTGKQPAIPEMIKNRDVDGIIIIGELPLTIIGEIRKFGLPIVLVDEHFRIKDLPAVEPDYADGAEKAASYLLQCGHERIAYIGESKYRRYGSQTLAGFRLAMKKAGKPVPDGYIQLGAGDSNADTGYTCMTAILGLKSKPTAVFCAADIYAVGAMRSVKDMGLSIPEDVSIIGMDDILLSEYVEPPLTTVKFNKREMGTAALKTLTGLIKGELSGAEKLSFKGTIVPRRTVKKLGA